MSSDESVCRVCLLSDPRGYRLQMKEGFKYEYTFLEMFNACTHLEAHVEDDLPQYICECCSDDLKITFDFLVKAAASDQILKGKVEEDKEYKYYDLSNEDNEAQEEQSLGYEEISESEHQIVEDDQLDHEVDSDKYENVQCDPMKTEYVDLNEGFDKQFEQFVEDELATENLYVPIEECTQTSDVEIIASECETEEDKHNTRKSNDSDRTSGIKTSTVDPVKENSKCVQCNSCGKILKQMSIKHHLKRCQKEEKLHLCSSCPKAFAVSCDLKIHMKTHDAERERTCICTECGKGFFGKQSLKIHMMRHMGVKEYQCKICPKKFTTKKSLDVHEFTHNREMGRFICKHCDKRFPSKADLTVHERFHTGDYPYQCEYCDKSYAVKSHYNYHLAKHKGITYKCDQCDKEFMNRGSLTAHRFKHNERMPHECPICKKGFASPFKLNRHKSCHKPKENDVLIE